MPATVPVRDGEKEPVRAGDRAPRSWAKQAAIAVLGSNAGLRRVSGMRSSWGAGFPAATATVCARPNLAGPARVGAQAPVPCRLNCTAERRGEYAPAP